MVAGGAAGRREDHELGAPAPVTQPAVPFLDGLESEVLRVPAAGTPEILRRQPDRCPGVIQRTRGRARRRFFSAQ